MHVFTLEEAISALAGAACDNFFGHWWIAQHAAVEWPHTIAMLNEHNWRWSGEFTCRALFENTRYWGDEHDEDAPEMNVDKLEELLRELASEIINDYGRWLLLTEKLGIPTAHPKDFVDYQARRLTELIDQTFADEHPRR